MAFSLLLCCFVSCSEEALDYNHPDVDLFVHQLKEGNLPVPTVDGASQMPKFTTKDIAALLDYADDLSVIPSFSLAPISYSAGGKLRLGECLLWTVETIRLGHNASMGCKMVHIGAENYEGIYFLSDEEVLDAIKFHCSGKAHMMPLSKIIYSADKIEPLRGYDSSKMVKACLRNYYTGFLNVLEENRKFLNSQSKPLPDNPLSEECYQLYFKEEQ